jgi:hypothetical protein
MDFIKINDGFCIENFEEISHKKTWSGYGPDRIRIQQ